MSPFRRRAPGDPPTLDVRHLSKRFGNALVLDDVTLEVLPGEVHGLLGQNGSGKSTLIKILAGFHDPEPGAQLNMYGAAARLPMPPGGARALGISFVHQHLALIPSLTVVENLRLNDFSLADNWAIDWRGEKARARETFERFGLAIDPAAKVSELSQVNRALVAIVRAFEDVRQNTSDDKGGLLILDEPTPFLPREGVEQLFQLVRGIADDGASVIFVSHDIDEIREITDRASVLRDGRLAGTVDTDEVDEDGFIELIVGRQVSLFSRAKASMAERPVAAAVDGLCAPYVNDVSFRVHEGEVVGLAGLIGSGFEAVPACLYGAKPADSGTLRVGDTALTCAKTRPQDAMAAGVAFLPADRLGAAGVGSLSITDNMSLPVLRDFRRWFGLDWSSIAARAAELGEAYDVRPNRPKLALANLSGGNAQKVLMAKWLQTAPKLLMLDEPTQGVDVGARQHLFGALDAAAQKGTAILVASSDAEQLAQICHRVLVFGQGVVVAELEGDALTKDAITDACLRAVTVGEESQRRAAA